MSNNGYNKVYSATLSSLEDDLVKEALLKAGREDLIGYDRKHCLIPPVRPAAKTKGKGNAGHKTKRRI